jgi:hypothetical protein
MKCDEAKSNLTQFFERARKRRISIVMWLELAIPAFFVKIQISNNEEK